MKVLYTIFAVVKVSKGWFMWGNDARPYRMLHSGYRDENTFTLDHYEQWLNISTRNLGDYQLFTLTFDVQKGMSIYENGIMRGSDPNLIQALQSNDGASFGLKYYWGGSGGSHEGFIAELRAYGTALKDEDRQIIEELLMRKYGLGAYGN